jgi:histidinol dehydrogenase
MSLVSLRFSGSLANLRPDDRTALLKRGLVDDDLVRDTVGAIVDVVRRDGDAALRALVREYDGVNLKTLEVPADRCAEALARLGPELREAMEHAARNIEAVHRAMLPAASDVSPEPGVVVTRRPVPLDRVGVYAPGGKAAYPSSVLMGAIPARVAGVREVIVCTPPGPTGAPSAAVLAACALAKVDRVFAVGGAGAIAAMAYGTETIPQVDRIVGPGNAWVTEAKLQVARVVAIDSPAGPSELLVLADESADAATVAREMVAQAEHDEAACVVAVTLGDALADRVEASLLAQSAAASRAAIVREALGRNGGILSAETREQALAFANAYAPEHLLLAVADGDAWKSGIRNAGAVFVGATSSVAFGDYITGGNHVLPTGGLARACSGLSTLEFVRWISEQTVTPEAARRLAGDVGRLATVEGLDAHARAALAWAGSEGA